MRLLLLHGRHDPTEHMDDWGFAGPVLHGVIAVHFTYGAANVFFESVTAAVAARAATGWEYWDDNALVMTFAHDMVTTTEDNEACFYGDWELQSKTPDGKPV